MVVIYPKKYGLTSAHEYRQNGQLVTYSYSLFSSVAAPRPHNSCHIASNPNEESNTLHQDGEKAHLTPTSVRSKRSIVSTHPYFDHSSASSTSTSGSISSTGSTGSIASLSSSTSNITKANMSRRFHEENENTQTNRGHFHINESLKSLSSRLNKHITPQMTHIREIVRNRQKHRPVERSEFIRQNIALNGTHKSRFDAIRSIIRGGGNNDGSGSSGNVVLGRRNKEGTEEGEIGEVNEEDMGNPHVDSSTYTDLAEDSSIRYNQQKDAEVTKNPMNSNKVRESKFGHHNVTQIADIKGVVSSSPSSPPLDTPSTIPRDIGDIYNKKYDRDVKNTFQGSTSEVPDGIGVTATDSMVIGDNAFITASNRKVIVNHEDLSQNSQQPQQSNLNKVLSTETPTSTSTSTSVPIPSTPTSTTSTISTAVIPDISLETEHTHVDEPVQTHRHISDCTRRYLRVYGEEHRRSLLSSDEYWREQIDTIPWFQKPKIVQYKLGQQNTSYTSDSTVPNPTLTQNAPLQQYIAEIEESENIQSDTVWYPDGTLNMSFAMLDHHILQGRGDQIAFYYESCYNSVLSKQSEVQQETEIKQETGVRKEATTRTTNMTKEEDNHTLGSMSVAMTYSELLKHVEAYAAGLRSYGIQKGDRVLIYMPMILETAIAMIACARVGAVHTVVFGGFASVELAKRMKSSGCKLVLTASCGLEPNKVIDYKSLVDKAFDVLQAEKEDIEKKYKKSGEEMTSEMRSDLKSQLVNLETILSNKVIIVQRKSFELPSSRFIPDRDVDVADFLLHGKKYKLSNPKASSPEVMSSYDPSYILYTSGTTGNPKGVIRDTGSTAVALYHSLRTVYGMYPGETWFAASDMGWQVGHSFIVYGPLLLGCSSVLFEGKPIQTPDASTYWRILAKYNVRGFFTAPTALRAIKREDPELKLLQKYKPYIQGVKTIDVGVDIDVDVDEDEDEREGEGKSKAKGKGKGKVNSIQFHGEGQRQGQGQGREEEYISATTTNTNTANTSTSSSTHTHISTSAISQSQHTSQSDDTSLPTKRLGLADLYGSTSVGVTTAIAVEDNHANPSHTTNTPSTKTSNSTEILKTEPVQGLFGYEFSSGLRALFIAGEKADSDTIDWLHDALDIPIIDHWWQTETGTPITGPVFPLNVLDEAKEISTNLGMISKYLEEHSDFEGDVEDEIEREIEKEKKREEERDKENISSNISSLSLPLSNHSHYTPVNHNHYIHWTIVPGSTGLPCFGYNVKILDDHGCEVPPLRIGNIVIQLPLPPGCLLGLWESGDRYKRGYTTRFPGYYDSADCGYIDEHGYLYVMSRTDDVMNVAGHRLSTGSIEEILAKHPKVAECCVVGLPDPLKGEVPIGFVVLKRGVETPNSRNDSVNIKNNIMKNITHDIPKDDKVHDNREEMHKKLQYELVQLVRSSVGSIATPKRIIVVDKLPKTKSGKLLRATIRNIIKFTKDKADEKFPIFSKIVPTPPTIEDETVLEYLRFVIEKEELF